MNTGEIAEIERNEQEKELRKWKRAAMEAMRYLDRDQIERVAAASGMQSFACGGLGEGDERLSIDRMSFDLQAAVYLAGACERMVKEGHIDARSEIGDAMLDFASGLYGDRRPIADLRADYEALRARRFQKRDAQFMVSGGEPAGEKAIARADIKLPTLPQEGDAIDMIAGQLSRIEVVQIAERYSALPGDARLAICFALKLGDPAEIEDAQGDADAIYDLSRDSFAKVIEGDCLEEFKAAIAAMHRGVEFVKREHADCLVPHSGIDGICFSHVGDGEVRVLFGDVGREHLAQRQREREARESRESVPTSSEGEE
jgi:hypothetical protein